MLAEKFAKASCIQRGFQNYPHIHNLDKLGDALLTNLKDADFADTVKSLNHDSHDDHMEHYIYKIDPDREQV